MAVASPDTPDFDCGFWSQARLALKDIRFSHTIFALPFALLAALMAAGGWPRPAILLWIVLACVFARSAAMSFNRLHDYRFDRLNPRTRNWPLVSGRLTRGFLTTFCAACCLAFVACAAMLNPLALTLSPVALGILLGYSTAKRWFAAPHFVLGLALGVAPIGAWIGVSGNWGWPAAALGLAVLLWVAGFDIIYSCQDEQFDRRIGLRSLPVRLGRARALAVSAACHAGAVLGFILAGRIGGLGLYYLTAVAVAACLLAYEQSIISPRDLSRLGTAFFTLNGWVSLLLLLGGALDLLR